MNDSHDDIPSVFHEAARSANRKVSRQATKAAKEAQSAQFEEEQELWDRTMNLFKRRSIVAAAYFNTQIDQGVPRDVAANNTSSMEHYFWRGFFKDGVVNE